MAEAPPSPRMGMRSFFPPSPSGSSSRRPRENTRSDRIPEEEELSNLSKEEEDTRSHDNTPGERKESGEVRSHKKTYCNPFSGEWGTTNPFLASSEPKVPAVHPRPAIKVTSVGGSPYSLLRATGEKEEHHRVLTKTQRHPHATPHNPDEYPQENPARTFVVKNTVSPAQNTVGEDATSFYTPLETMDLQQITGTYDVMDGKEGWKDRDPNESVPQMEPFIPARLNFENESARGSANSREPIPRQQQELVARESYPPEESNTRQYELNSEPSSGSVISRIFNPRGGRDARRNNPAALNRRITCRKRAFWILLILATVMLVVGAIVLLAIEIPAHKDGPDIKPYSSKLFMEALMQVRQDEEEKRIIYLGDNVLPYFNPASSIRSESSTPSTSPVSVSNSTSTPPSISTIPANSTNSYDSTIRSRPTTTSVTASSNSTGTKLPGPITKPSSTRGDFKASGSVSSKPTSVPSKPASVPSNPATNVISKPSSITDSKLANTPSTIITTPVTIAPANRFPSIATTTTTTSPTTSTGYGSWMKSLWNKDTKTVTAAETVASRPIFDSSGLSAEDPDSLSPTRPIGSTPVFNTQSLTPTRPNGSIPVFGSPSSSVAPGIIKPSPTLIPSMDITPSEAILTSTPTTPPSVQIIPAAESTPITLTTTPSLQTIPAPELTPALSTTSTPITPTQTTSSQTTPEVSTLSSTPSTTTTTKELITIMLERPDYLESGFN